MGRKKKIYCIVCTIDARKEKKSRESIEEVKQEPRRHTVAIECGSEKPITFKVLGVEESRLKIIFAEMFFIHR